MSSKSRLWTVGIGGVCVGLLVGVLIGTFPRPYGVYGLYVSAMSGSAEPQVVPDSSEPAMGPADAGGPDAELEDPAFSARQAAIAPLTSSETIIESSRLSDQKGAYRTLSIRVQRWLPESFFDYFDYGQKATSFISAADPNFVVAQGDGQFLIGVLEHMRHTGNISLSALPSNLPSLLDVEVLRPSWFSLKGLLVTEEWVVVSTSHAKVEKSGLKCWNTAVYRAKMSTERLNFALHWSPGECVTSDDGELNGHQAGGALALDPSGELWVSHGDYRIRDRAQDASSAFGSILSLGKVGDPSPLVRVRVIGVRNPQGMFIERINEDLLSLTFVDQGPRGGDELNQVVINPDGLAVPNFGWPISSYGKHYSGEEIPNAPLVDNHEKLGFIEPLRAWNPSIAPSSVIRLPRQDGSNGETVVVGSMGLDSTSGRRSLLFVERVPGAGVVTEQFFIGDRVRSLNIWSRHEGKVLATFDDGSFGVIEIREQD